MKAHRAMRRRGSHIFQTIGSRMAVRLSASRAGRPVPAGRFREIISVRGWVAPRAIVRLEGLGQLKNPMTSSGIEPATFRLVAQCNQLRYRVLLPLPVCIKYITDISHYLEHNSRCRSLLSPLLLRQLPFIISVLSLMCSKTFYWTETRPRSIQLLVENVLRLKSGDFVVCSTLLVSSWVQLYPIKIYMLIV
jgi:hypothetical protein